MIHTKNVRRLPPSHVFTPAQCSVRWRRLLLSGSDPARHILLIIHHRIDYRYRSRSMAELYLFVDTLYKPIKLVTCRFPLLGPAPSLIPIFQWINCNGVALVGVEEGVPRIPLFRFHDRADAVHFVPTVNMTVICLSPSRRLNLYCLTATHNNLVKT